MGSVTKNARQASMVVAYSRGRPGMFSYTGRCVNGLPSRFACNLLGVEYSAAIPARKSRAKSLPPVAEAAYGP